MKKIPFFVFVYFTTLSSCINEEECYRCENKITGDVMSNCAPKLVAESEMRTKEDEGYTCNKR